MELTDADGAAVPHDLAPALEPGTFRVTYVGQTLGPLRIAAALEGTPVRGSPWLAAVVSDAGRKYCRGCLAPTLIYGCLLCRVCDPLVIGPPLGPACAGTAHPGHTR